MIRIGLYSEDAALRLLLSTSLGNGFRVLLEPSEDGRYDSIAAGECDVALLDLKGNHDAPKERLERFRRIILSRVRSVIMADYDMRPTVVELVKLGASDYCSRRSSIRDIEAFVRKAHESREEKVGRFGQMVGASAQMQHVYRLVSSVANTNASVLVTGESGTGKELIARAIHDVSARSDSPFVAVSAGAIPETLLEAELFGHEKGAFTGTVGSRKGYLEEVGSGTLFLDEIGDLSLQAQVKLLRVLQQREFCRLGSSRLIPLRARFVFATHRNLEELVARGEFREDLYYRINVFKILAPPLRERGEDIPLLADHFLRLYSGMYQKTFKHIEPGALLELENHTWPGNIRQLENVIQKSTIVGLGDTIRKEDLGLNIRPDDNGRSDNIVCIGDYEPAGSFELKLRDFKIKVAENAVREHNGNKSQAARSLNISRAYLYHLIGLAEGGVLPEENNVETAQYDQISAYQT
jgi:DNA-binding NtrC family response regulator